MDDNENTLYFHIGNSGMSFFVEDTDKGPMVGVEAYSFGHRLVRTELFVTQDGLEKLAQFFDRQQRREYSEPYACAAEVPSTNLTTNAEAI